VGYGGQRWPLFNTVEIILVTPTYRGRAFSFLTNGLAPTIFSVSPSFFSQP